MLGVWLLSASYVSRLLSIFAIFNVLNPRVFQVYQPEL